MDVATREEIRSSAYKNKRGRIIRSSGIADTAGAGLQTLAEQNLGVKGEYFIDNVRTQAYVSPNPYSGISNVTRIEFEVIEPYSIGLFLETLELAASEAGYNNYLDAPFVLGVEFVGYESNGSVSTDEKRVLLLKITKATFNVTSAGSVYTVQAIPWNHQALLDNTTSIPVNINIKGDTVEEILTSLDQEGITETVTNTRPDGLGANVVEISGTRSLIKALNDHEEEQVKLKKDETQRNITATEFEILFPVDPNDPGTKNEFARYQIADSFAYTGNVDLGVPELIYDEDNALYTRGSLSIDEESRVYQFRRGTKIEKIIEEVILTSKWADDVFDTEPDSEGYIEWFKVLSFVEILDGDEDRFGSLPKKYTFMVYPYRVHISTLVPTQTTINYNSCVRNAVRGYSYTYTGENSDIIDFNIDIDYAWIQAVPNLTQRSGVQTDQGGNLTVDEETFAAFVEQGFSRREAQDRAREAVANQEATTDTFTNHQGGDIDNEQTRVARAYNDAIVNSNADLIKLKMTVWGDPYFLADTDYGGYIAQRAIPNQSSDGAMDHIRSEVDVLIRFSGAVDYKNSLLLPNTARQFSGVYKLIRVNSMFENNMFKQELEMIRRRNQDDATIENCISSFTAQETGGTPFLRPATSGVNAGDLTLFLRQAEETELMFNIFGQLKLQDLTAALNITPFGLISQLNGFSQLFDQARQIRSAIGNLGSLAGNINLSNLNAQSLQQLGQQLNDAQGFFEQAFTQIDVSTITQTLNQDLSNVAGQFRGALGQVTGQIQGAVGEFQGAVRTLSDIPGQVQGLAGQVGGALGQVQGLAGQVGGALGQVQGLAGQVDQIMRITSEGVQGANVPTAPPLPGLSSIVRPTPRPQNLNPTGTRLVETPEGPRRVVVGAGGRDQVSAATQPLPQRQFSLADVRDPTPEERAALRLRAEERARFIGPPVRPITLDDVR